MGPQAGLPRGPLDDSSATGEALAQPLRRPPFSQGGFKTCLFETSTQWSIWILDEDKTWDLKSRREASVCFLWQTRYVPVLTPATCVPGADDTRPGTHHRYSNHRADQNSVEMTRHQSWHPEPADVITGLLTLNQAFNLSIPFPHLKSEHEKSMPCRVKDKWSALATLPGSYRHNKSAPLPSHIISSARNQI